MILSVKYITAAFVYLVDDISGTYFAQAREYLPEAGRFAGRDILKGKIDRPASLNEYVYCHNNPVGYVDLDGMKPKEITAHSLIDKGEDTIESWTIGSGIDRVGVEISHNISTRGITRLDNKYIADIDKQIKRLKKKKSASGRRPGSLILERRRVISEKTTKEQRRYDVGQGKVKFTDMTVVEIGTLLGKNAIIGGAVDAGLGIVEDYYAGTSTSKLLTNAVVNGGFGAVEGAFVTGSTLLFGPIGTAAGIVAVLV